MTSHSPDRPKALVKKTSSQARELGFPQAHSVVQSLWAEMCSLSPWRKKIFDSGLWPREKKMSRELGLSELEELWYELFYRGKNADLYVCPGTEDIQVLQVRSDRTSVFDIPLDLEIAWKWEIQSQISQLWAQFVVERGFVTCYTEWADNIPEHLRARSQCMSLCAPLTMKIDGHQKGLELVIRNFHTGSLFQLYQKWQDPYGLNISPWMLEWERFDTPQFTPTTKEKNDTPLNSEMVRSHFPQLIERLEALFADFTDHMNQRWYVVVDTKLEVFINSSGEYVLWDEIFTPESSRFIKKEDFEAGRYISADKQIIRNLGRELGWKEKWRTAISQNPEKKFLTVSESVGDDIRLQVLEWYQWILRAMNNERW